MAIGTELIDESPADPESVMRHNGLTGKLKKVLPGRLAAGFDHHPAPGRASGEDENHRNDFLAGGADRGQPCHHSP